MVLHNTCKMVELADKFLAGEFGTNNVDDFTFTWFFDPFDCPHNTWMDQEDSNGNVPPLKYVRVMNKRWVKVLTKVDVVKYATIIKAFQQIIEESK